MRTPASWIIAHSSTGRGLTVGWAALWKRPCRSWCTASWTWTIRQMYPRLHQQEYRQHLEGCGIVPSALHLLGQSWNTVSCSALQSPGLPSSGETWKIRRILVDSQQNDQRVGEVDIGRKVAGTGCVQPREEKAQGDLTTVLQYLKGSYRDWGALFTRMPSDKTRGKGHKFLQGEFHLNVRKEILPCDNN